MGQLLVPALIGAGVGAVGGLATGQNPFKGALLGGALGAGGAGLMGGAAAGGATAAGTAGVGAGEGLIGGSLLSTAGGVGVPTAAGATGGLGNFLSSIRGIETTPVSFGTGGYASGIGGQAVGGSGVLGALEGQSLEQALNLNIPKQNLADITSPEAIANNAFSNSKFQPSGLFEPSSFRNLDTGASVGAPFSTEAFTNNPLMAQQMINNAGQTTSMMSDMRNYISNLPENAMNYVTNNPLSSAKMAFDVATPAPQQQTQAPIPPILRGNYDPSSALSNVSPNANPKLSKNGLLDMMASIPMTDEERMRLQQLGYRG
jgi:hypothetical protein